MKKLNYFGNDKIRKLILVVTILLVSFIVVSLGIADDQHVGIEKKVSKTSGKCWKRTWLSSEALWGKSTMPVCKAFEEVLNKTCEPPEKLKCNWTIPVAEEKFKKLIWKEIDPKVHWDLIRDIVLSGWNEKYRAGKWEHYEPEYKKNLAEGRLKLFTTSAIMVHDGKEEQVVCLRRTPDCPSRGTYAVMIPATRQIDWRYRDLLGNINSYDGSEIMLYDGSVYLFQWEEVPGRINIYRTFSLFENTEFGSTNICQFVYLKGRKAK